jgi:hypothetical protein
MLDLGHDALFENLTVGQLIQESPFYIIQRLFLTRVRFGFFPAINVNNSVLGCDTMWPGRCRHLVFILISRHYCAAFIHRQCFTQSFSVVFIKSLHRFGSWIL